MVSHFLQTSDHSVLSTSFDHHCDEDSQPCPGSQQFPTGPDEALHTWDLLFSYPISHQPPASGATAINSETSDSAPIQQWQHTIACW